MSFSGSFGKIPNIVPGSANQPRMKTGAPLGYDDLAQRLSAGLWDDISKGQGWASQYFGRQDPDMARLIAAREKAAYGNDTKQMDQERAIGLRGINSSLATGLRQLKGLQGATGLRGGAAIGQALPQLTQANLARGDLESKLAVANMQRREQALKDLESTLTGERAGRLGSTLGIAGLGSQNRYGTLEYLTADKNLQAALAEKAAAAAAAANAGGGGGPDRKWYEEFFTNVQDKSWRPGGVGGTGALGKGDVVGQTIDKYNPMTRW